MTIYIIPVILFLFIASSYNYVAYNHVQRYKYYKNVSSASFSQYLIGLIAGIPFIFIPFVTREKDQDFMKYSNIKSTVWIARLLILLLLISISLVVVERILR